MRILARQHVPKVILDGVPEATRDVARHELRLLLNRPEASSLFAFTVTRTPRDAIRRLRGFRSLEPDLPQGWADLAGAAKTLAGRVGLLRNRIGYVIAIDANVFPADWRPAGALGRRFYVEHELNHVQTMAALVRSQGGHALARLITDRDAPAAQSFNGHVVWWEYEATRAAAETVLRVYGGDQVTEFVRGVGWDSQFETSLREIERLTRLQHPIQAMALGNAMTLAWAYKMGFEAAGVAISDAYKRTATYDRIFAPIAEETIQLLEHLHERRLVYEPSNIQRLAALVERSRRLWWPALLD